MAGKHREEPMETIAAAMTEKGTGAISTVQVYGENALSILKKIFKSQSGKSDLTKGKIFIGHIFDSGQVIDQVTVGCESDKSYAIHCHGNPLIVADIIRVLEKNGARPVTAEQMICRMAEQDGKNAIAIEAQLAGAKSKTLAGNKIIASQVKGGLVKAADEWLSDIENVSIEQIRAEAERIVGSSQAARFIIEGCKVVIAGPANSGKSTLMNALCGREKAIVSDIKGTTRDWVEGSFLADSLFVELIDTAGLWEYADSIDKTSQEKSVELLEQADIVLIVLDGSDAESKMEKSLAEKVRDKKIITAVNKCDLTALPVSGDKSIKISAKTGEGLDGLKDKIRELCGVGEFDIKQAVSFTDRQEKLIRKLAEAKSKKQAVSIITELLNGKL